MLDIAHIDPDKLEQLGVDQLRELVGRLLEGRGRDAQDISWRDAKIDELTFEVAQLKRLKYSTNSEQFSADQRARFDEAVDGDIAAIEEQLAALKATLPPKTADGEKKTPKRGALPAHLPRAARHHEPENTTCGCGCQMSRIGEDVSEKLDYTLGVLTVERHVRGKWSCARCRTLVQAPVPAAVIDKGIPTAGLLAQVIVAKHADHLPLYRQEPDLRPRRTVAPALDTRGLGWSVRCPTAAPGGGVEGALASLPGAARRRDLGGDAGAGQGQDPPCLPVGLHRSAQ
jgi:transposase